MRLSELITVLSLHSGHAWSDRPDDPPHVQEDPEVYLVDAWGANHAIGEVRLDFAPTTLSEADEDVRHPVVELFQLAAQGSEPAKS